MLYDHATKLRIQVHDHIYNRKLKSIPHFRLVPHGFTKTISDSESARLFIHALGHQNEITNTHHMREPESIRQITFKAPKKQQARANSNCLRPRSLENFFQLPSMDPVNTLLDSSESANIGIIPSRHATTTINSTFLQRSSSPFSSLQRSEVGVSLVGFKKTPRVQTFELQTQKRGGEHHHSRYGLVENCIITLATKHD